MGRRESLTLVGVVSNSEDAFRYANILAPAYTATRWGWHVKHGMRRSISSPPSARAIAAYIIETMNYMLECSDHNKVSSVSSGGLTLSMNPQGQVELYAASRLRMGVQA